MSSGTDYEVLEVIGQGSFGQIRKVRRKTDGLILVRKEISYVKMSQKEREQLQTEFQLLATLKHPNIVEYFHRDHIKSDSMLHLYMEYCGNGDLSQVIKQCQQEGTLVPEHLVWSIFAQIILALYRCHFGVDPPPVGDGNAEMKPPIPVKGSFTVLHRDLKPENVFLDQDNSVKLGDFGLSKLLHGDHHFATTYVGTPFYMSPELIKDLPYTSKSDIWSLGCVIYELCKLSPPFNAKTHFNLCQKIKEGKYPPIPSQYSSELREVIGYCLQVDPKMRPDTARLLTVPSIKLARRESEAYHTHRTLKLREEKIRLREQQLVLKEQELTKEWTERGKRLDIELRNKWAAAAEAEVQKRVAIEIAAQLPKLVEEEVQRRLAALEQKNSPIEPAVVAQHAQTMPVGALRTHTRPTTSNTASTNPPSPCDVDMMMSPAPNQRLYATNSGSPRRRSAEEPFHPPTSVASEHSHSHNPGRRPGLFSNTTAPGKAQGNTSTTSNLFTHQPTLAKMMHTSKINDDSDISPLRPGTAHAASSAPNLPAIHRLSIQEETAKQTRNRKQMGSTTSSFNTSNNTSNNTTSSFFTNRDHLPLQPLQTNLLPTSSQSSKATSNSSTSTYASAATSANNTRNTSFASSLLRGRSLVEISREAKADSRKVSTRRMVEQEAARWDPEVDEMPSPFLKRGRIC